jgi:hypothetical protein
MNALVRACTLEIRKEIREQRSGSEDRKAVDPAIPFATWGEELEVFTKAKFMAKHEAAEQMNMEFYVWYRSKIWASHYFWCAFSMLEFDQSV